MNFVVFCSSWLSIFSHKKNQFSKSAQTPVGHPKSVCGEKVPLWRKRQCPMGLAIFHRHTLDDLGEPDFSVAMIYVD